jgi:dephospho-CoA kinase
MIAPGKTLVIALTGGIAAGKSAVESRFRALGVHVHDADSAAREVIALGTPGLASVVEAFGPQVLDDTGKLDRRAMRERVFGDASARRQLESIVHPLVRDWLLDKVATETGPYCLLAIPLLAENISHYRWIKHVLLVDAPESVQLDRLIRRDGIDEALAHRMLAQQATRAERLAIADYVIDNSGDEAELGAAVAELHSKFLALARKHSEDPDQF